MNINKLKGKIVENGMKPEEFAKEIGVSTATYYRVMKNPEKITIGMARKMKASLKMSDGEAIEIFLS